MFSKACARWRLFGLFIALSIFWYNWETLYKGIVMNISVLFNRKILLLLWTYFFVLFNVAYAIEIPDIKVDRAAKIDKIAKLGLPNLVIEKVMITGPNHDLSWYATVRNTGQTISKNKLEVTGYQMIGSRAVAKAGEKLLWTKKFDAKSTLQFARQKWSKAKDATYLKLVIKNKQNGKSVSKIVSLPKSKSTKPAKAATTSAIQHEYSDILSKIPKLQVLDTRYLGRGAFEVKIKSIGERGFMPNEIEIRPIYNINNKLPMIGKTVTNRSGIPVGKTKTVSSRYPNIYENGMSECWHLGYMMLEIKNKTTGEIIERRIGISKPQGEVVDIDMEQSKVTYSVKNTGSFTTKYYIKTRNFMLYKWNTTGDGANKPNYHKRENEIMQLKNLFDTSITVKAGETASVSINKARVNAEVKQQFTSMRNNETYMAAQFNVLLYNKFDASCGSKKEFDSEYFRQGRSSSGNEIVTWQ
mgnify:CR=1 FL=1